MAENQKKDKRKVVPWFSMLEWQDVYNQVYSGDVEAQQKGYEKILVWKARCPTLPPGIECTLSLVHVSLQDQQIWPRIVDGLLPPYQEYNLRLMYSTAIMRFLNQISLVAKDQFETLYKMARKVHIPDWMVNIRHDLAHGHNLPSLNVLRSATHFALDWIHEHYWKGELKLAADYFAIENPVVDDQAREHFQEYIELWQALKLYHLHGYSSVVDIPDPAFLCRLSKVIQRLQTKRRVLHAASSAEAPKEIATDVFLKDREVKSVLNQLLKHIDIFVARNKKHLPIEELVTILLEGETFIPNEDLYHALVLENDDTQNGLLPTKVRTIWQNLLPLLPETDLYRVLLERLLQLVNKKEETTHRRTVAAKWLKEICLSLIKANWVHRTFSQVEYDLSHDLIKVKEKGKKKNKNTDGNHDLQKTRRKIIQEVENLHPEMKNILTINACDISNSLDLLELILISPNQWTLTFLSSFLDLVKPEVSSTVKLNIIKLVQTYTCTSIGSKSKEVEQHEVYTLDMLTNSMEKPIAIESNDVEMDNEPTKLQDNIAINKQNQQDHGSIHSIQQHSLSWTKSEAYHEWENCPLGILPWQKTENIANISFICDSIWKCTAPTNSTAPVQWLPSHVHETVDWDNIQPVRKRLKKLKKNPNLLKKACELTVKRVNLGNY